MPVTARVWDGAGRLLLDETTSTGRMFGSFEINYASNPNGSLVDDRFAESGARPFGVVMSTLQQAIPRISFAGNVLTWTRTPDQSGQFPATGTYRVFYGAT